MVSDGGLNRFTDPSGHQGPWFRDKIQPDFNDLQIYLIKSHFQSWTVWLWSQIRAKKVDHEKNLIKTIWNWNFRLWCCLKTRWFSGFLSSASEIYSFRSFQIQNASSVSAFCREQFMGGRGLMSDIRQWRLRPSRNHVAFREPLIKSKLSLVNDLAAVMILSQLKQTQWWILKPSALVHLE